jgi:hypothetical protein
VKSALLLAEQLEQHWPLIRDFFAERNWPDSKLGDAAACINSNVADMLKLLRYGTAVPELPEPTHDEIVQATQLYRAEITKRMDTKHPSASPSIESMTITLRDLFGKMRKRLMRSAP